MKLTVFFEGEFWVGIVEAESGGVYKACRHVFGSEPYDAEVLDFVRRDMLPLLERVQAGIEAGTPPLDRGRVNPKRLAREAAREMQRTGVRSLAQDALMRDLEHRKKTRRIVTKAQKEAEQARRREIAVQKAKAKHRGR
ncbi:MULTISPECIES: YjdF family protein [Paenibacillus]|uniref:YjdF family protein n=1 Tax=Paenibacillus TaxID=44249 RepID=UPI0022B9229C|nr:YjdF family protein [Paenibacillus caseinilyticus]MCZ8517974.1 YjdF family protein [Paenibacillus caseinilyticus]